MKGVALFLVAEVIAAVSVAGCSKPGTGAGGGDVPVATCAKAEQKCVYSDGKLGLCTPSAMECDGSAQCLVCMSLH